MTGLNHSPFAGLSPADYSDGLTARERRQARDRYYRARQNDQARARALVFGYGEGFALHRSGDLRCIVNKGKRAYLDAESALAELTVFRAEQVADPNNALDRRYGRCYRCDVPDMLEHWHLTHWAADSPRGHAWPSPWWPPMDIDPWLPMLPMR